MFPKDMLSLKCQLSDGPNLRLLGKFEEGTVSEDCKGENIFLFNFLKLMSKRNVEDK